jgi:hypothetical protein
MVDDVKAQWKIQLDHPVRPASRWGYGRSPHPQLAEIIAAGRARYRSTLEGCFTWSEAFDAISPKYVNDTEPYWGCGWMSPLDLMVLYSVIASNRPSRYVEVGSGCSTAFARRAIQDNNLQTRITSIDPEPRADIDTICDEVMRESLENLDLAIFEELSAGDVVLVDGSHRTFTNSDATVAVLEVLPRLKPGVVMGFDDIYLPNDYPPHWWNRFYSEQYLLAGWLLGGGKGLEIIFPSAFALTEQELSALVERLLAKDIFEGLSKGGNTFWMKKTPV